MVLKNRIAKNTYTFRDSYTDCVYVTRATPLRTYKPLMYSKRNIPEWAWQGMRMLDVARDPATGKGLIPGFGRVNRGTYVFYPILEDVPM
jgi:hypothetical protein